jgi:hypothetical protein
VSHIDKMASVLKRIKVSGDNRRVPQETITQLGVTGQLPQPVTIDALSDNVLLEIFDVYMDEYRFRTSSTGNTQHSYDGWHTLVHVCDRWRCVVFASPRRLGM